MLNNAQMEAQITPILFVHYGDEWLRGSERCLLDLLNHIDKSSFKPVVWCNSSAFSDAVRNLDLDIAVHQSSFPLLLGWQAPKFDVSAWKGLVSEGKTLIQQYGIQLVHANSGAPCQWLNHVARKCRIPLVAHLHSRYPARDRITLGLHQTPISVGVSQPVVQQLLEDGVPESAVAVIPNGIDTEALDAVPAKNLRESIGIPGQAFLMVTTGSLIHRKGVDLLIEAVGQIREQELDAHLAVLGAGEESEALKRQATESGLDAYVHFLGEQTGVTGWLRGGADLFVSGAREEVFGLALAEASLCKLAVIAPDVGGISSVIAHGSTGLLVTPESSAAITEAVLTLAQNPEQRHQMGTSGRQRVLEHFTIKKNVERFEQLYRQQLQASDQPAPWRPGLCLRLMGSTVLKTIMRKAGFKTTNTEVGKVRNQHVLILDPTAFSGGSKIATDHLLRPLINTESDVDYRITVLTADARSWNSLADRTLRLYLPDWLARQQQGLPFFALNGWIAAQVLLTRLRAGKIDIAIGASGPGVDLSLYLARSLTSYRVLQLVHGPVAASRTIGRCLDQADQVQYLDTTRESLHAALGRHRPGRDESLPETFHPFHNTLPASSWPSQCQYTKPTVLWAASLLGWKGLPTLTDALKAIPESQRPDTNICYIRPAQTDLPISEAPLDIPGVNWFEQPDNLDAIRASSNIFVSTSHKEPFGLSILEAMAAGHCVLIPEDGAYWDKRLIHDRECIKYPAGDHTALADILRDLTANPERIQELGCEAASHAQAYRSDKQPDSLRHFFSLLREDA